MTLKQQIVGFLRRMGYDLSRYQPDQHADARRLKQIALFGIDLVIDVGANVGDYGVSLRSGGYRGRIVSFEPLSSVYSTLEQAASGDSKWETRHSALGAQQGSQKIHVAGNTASSSLLEMLPAHKEAAPYACYVGEETIQVESLDGIFTDLRAGAESIWLKIDTQGFEKQVLDGATLSLEKIDTVQMEVSFTPLYEGAVSYRKLIEFMETRGYEVIGVEPGFSDPNSGRVLQADFTFHRFRAS